jgi:hypothetical protein
MKADSTPGNGAGSRSQTGFSKNETESYGLGSEEGGRSGVRSIPFRQDGEEATGDWILLAGLFVIDREARTHMSS